MMEQQPRRLSGRYELVELLARGGMAEVYRARDLLLDRPVALKVLFPELSVDRSFVERFKREAQSAAKLSHANIVPVFDWGEDGGTYFIVMELIEGRTLSAILRAAGPLHPDRAAEIGADVAGALSYAHRYGMVHRDVKPGNILITEEGVVKVTDFGIARAINTEESLTQTGAVMGTATYFSPEQAEGVGVDGRSDIYSLGVVLFEMVTGRPPFMGESPVAVASKHVREMPPRATEVNPAVPPALEAIISKCMAKSPDYRYASGDDLRVDLLRFREGRAVAAGPLPPAAMGLFPTTQALGGVSPHTQAIPGLGGMPVGYQEPERPSRNGAWVAVLLLLVVALGLLGYFLGKSQGWWGSTTSSFQMPDVSGKTVGTAKSILQGDGLKVSVPANTPDSANVTGTQPAANTSVHKGETVTLQVSNTTTTAPTTPAQVAVPDEVSSGTVSVSAAKADITSKGLQPKVVQSSDTSTCPISMLNLVCAQNPAPGTMVAPGSTVTISTPQPQTTTQPSTPTITVPNVAGQTVTQACATLQNNNLVCASTQQQQSSDQYPAGQVITTSPAPHTSQPVGTAITLIVSTGPSSGGGTTTTTVPSGLVGQSVVNAENALTGVNLGYTLDSSCPQDSNTVLVTRTDPTAGSPAPSSGKVNLIC